MTVPGIEQVEHVRVFVHKPCCLHCRPEVFSHELPRVSTPSEGFGGCDIQREIPDLLEGEVVMTCQVVVNHMGAVERSEAVRRIVVGIIIGRAGLVVPPAVVSLRGIAVCGAFDEHRRIPFNGVAEQALRQAPLCGIPIRVSSRHPVGDVAVFVCIAEVLAHCHALDGLTELVHALSPCKVEICLYGIEFISPVGIFPGDKRVGIDDRSVGRAEDREYIRFLLACNADCFISVKVYARIRGIFKIVVHGVGVTHLHGPCVVRGPADHDAGNAWHRHTGYIQTTTPDGAFDHNGRHRKSHLRT